MEVSLVFLVSVSYHPLTMVGSLSCWNKTSRAETSANCLQDLDTHTFQFHEWVLQTQTSRQHELAQHITEKMDLLYRILSFIHKHDHMFEGIRNMDYLSKLHGAKQTVQ